MKRRKTEKSEPLVREELDKPPPLKDLGGRPTKCTPELTEEFCHYVKRMLPPDRVCGLLGITPVSYYSWMKQGREYAEAVEEGNKPIASHKIFYMFMMHINRAKAQYMMRILNRSFVSDKAQQQWQRDAWLLERRDRVNWARHERMDVAEVEDVVPDESFL